MANEQNLKPFSKEKREISVKCGSKGGKASGKAKRERKAMREQMEMLLSLPLKDGSLKRQIEELGIADKNIDNQMALIIATWNKAMKGDMTALNQIREIIGEKVIEVNLKQNIDENVKEFEQYVNDRKTT